MYCSNCGNELQSGQNFCPVCGQMVQDIQAEHGKVQVVKNGMADIQIAEAEKLKEYMFKVKELEGLAYEERVLLSNIKAEENRYKSITKQAYESKQSKNFSDSFGTGLFVGAGISFIPAIIFWMVKTGYPGNGIIFGLLTAAVIGVVVGIIFIIGESIETKKRNEEIDKRNRWIAEQNERTDREIKHALTELEKQYKIVETKTIRTNEILNRLYALNILHPDYRNIVAVCSLCQYLDSERCYSLKGYDGAYNIYEQEKRMDIIITKLVDIIENLKQIQRNQQMIYNAIVSAHTAVSEVMQGIRSDLKKNQAINQEIREYSRISAENSNAMLFLETWKS